MAKGVKTGGGSRKGVPNRATANIKSMIENALDDAGGVEYLRRQAEENPGAFMSLIGKILPKDVNTTISGGLSIKKIEVEIVNPTGSSTSKT